MNGIMHLGINTMMARSGSPVMVEAFGVIYQACMSLRLGLMGMTHNPSFFS
jgi:hypothetical protein